MWGMCFLVEYLSSKRGVKGGYVIGGFLNKHGSVCLCEIALSD
jgi:hypothetical protein